MLAALERASERKEQLEKDLANLLPELERQKARLRVSPEDLPRLCQLGPRSSTSSATACMTTRRRSGSWRDTLLSFS